MYKRQVYLEEKFCENYTITVVVRNAKDNNALIGAMLSVVHETRAANGGDQIFNEAVSAFGELKVKVESKGTYVIEVTKEGFKTQTIRHYVDIKLGDCDGAAPIYSIIVPEVPCPGGVTVSLTWLEEPKDLDLYGYKVGQANDNQTRCLVYYCDGKDPCNAVSYTHLTLPTKA